MSASALGCWGGGAGVQEEEASAEAEEASASPEEEEEASGCWGPWGAGLVGGQQLGV